MAQSPYDYPDAWMAHDCEEEAWDLVFTASGSVHFCSVCGDEMITR